LICHLVGNFDGEKCRAFYDIESPLERITGGLEPLPLWAWQEENFCSSLIDVIGSVYWLFLGYY